MASPLVQGLVGCWLLNEGGGKKAVDLIGNNHLNLDANCYYDGNGIRTANSPYYWTQSQPNVPAALIDTAFTVMSRFIPIDTSATYLPFMSVRSNLGTCWEMRNDTSTMAAFAIYRTNGGWTEATLNSVLTVGKAVTFIAVFTSTSATLYASSTNAIGSITFADTTVGNIAGSSTSYFAIGGDAYYHYATGYSLPCSHSAAMLWGRALSVNEVKLLMDLTAGW